MRTIKSAVAKSPIGLSCCDLEERVDAYLENELGWPAKMKIRMHAAMCRDCTSYLRAYTATRDLVRAAIRTEAEGADTLPDDIARKILERKKSGPEDGAA